MFAALETRASGLCIGVFIAIVLLGKMFGGSLKGLIPTAMCIVSGIFLWTKEVIRSGREVEWSSEQSRGETVSDDESAILVLVHGADEYRQRPISFQNLLNG